MFLDNIFRRVVRTCAEVSFTKKHVNSKSVDNICSFVHNSPLKQRALLYLLLFGVELSPLLVGPVRRPLTYLEEEDQIEVFNRLYSSDIYEVRMAFIAMRTMLVIGWFSSPGVHNILGLKHNVDPFKLSQCEN